MALTKPSKNMLPNLADMNGNLPVERVPGAGGGGTSIIRKLMRKTVTTDDDISYGMVEMSAFRKNMFIPESGLVLLTWSADFSHRGINAGVAYDPPLNATGNGHMPLGSYYPIGIAGQIVYKRAATEAGLAAASFSFHYDSVGAGQLTDRKGHYMTVGAARSPLAVDANYWYQFSLALTSHTDAGSMSGVNGAAELTTGGGRNFVQVEYQSGYTIEP